MLMKYNYMDIIKRSLSMYLESTVIQSQLINYFRLIYHQNIYKKNYNSKIIHNLKKKLIKYIYYFVFNRELFQFIRVFSERLHYYIFYTYIK